jgi:glutathione S-transferase
MITVHHLNNSRSQRVLWLLEELGLEYEIKRYERDPKTIRAPDSLKSVHALGKSPVITDGGITVAESGAIIEYLIRQYGQEKMGLPDGSAAQRDYTYWLHFAEGSLMPPMIMKLVFDKVKTSPMPFFAKPIAKGIADKVMKNFVSPEIVSALRYIDSYLGKREWFAGSSLSGADVQMSFPLEAGVARGTVHEGNYPNIYRFVKTYQQRPAYLAALEKGGDYDYGPKAS